MHGYRNRMKISRRIPVLADRTDGLQGSINKVINTTSVHVVLLWCLLVVSRHSIRDTCFFSSSSVSWQYTRFRGLSNYILMEGGYIRILIISKIIYTVCYMIIE